MAERLIAFASAFVFGLGLLLSGMSNPAKVIGFLDVFGRWDPSLAFVMLGAIAVAAPAFAIAKRRRTAWTGHVIDLPRTTIIDRRLLLGSVLFGIGWGLAGLCPGPALVDAATLDAKSLVFVVSMLIGMVIVKFADRPVDPKPVSDEPQDGGAA